MKARHIVLATAALVAGAANVSIATAPAFAQSLESVAVPYQDLNLTHAAGQRVLDNRIDAAAKQLCGEFLTVELKWSEMSRICRAEVIASVQPQRDALVGGQRFASLRVSRAAN